MIHKFTFKGTANKPSHEWEKGFSDSLNDQKYWYSRYRKLKGNGSYTCGYAEGNITAHCIWRDYWQNTINNRHN